MSSEYLESAVATVPAGAWAVGTSGGADSVALLALLRSNPALQLHVVHLDHQTRGNESTGDAEFVVEFSRRLNLPCTMARRQEIEPQCADLPANPSAKYRALRLALFRQVVLDNKLAGVILAHHADDQAETVLQRLIRGSSYAGLAGMSPRTVVGGLTILRPLLGVRRSELRDYLQSRALSWREDASNQSDQYLRNRLRRMLAGSEALIDALLQLARTCAALRDWARKTAPTLGEHFAAAQLMNLPQILADESARRWLADRGLPIEQIDSSVIDRLLMMVNDAASPARQNLPGSLTLRRRGGVIFADAD